MSHKDESVARSVDNAELRTFVLEVLHSVGVTEDHARIVAEALVRADLRGVDSHGVARLETYVEKFEGGGFNTAPHVTIEEIAPVINRVDGDDGPGQVAALRGMEAAMERAAAHGMGASFVYNSNHFGTAAYYTQHAAEHDFIGISMTNVGPDVVPFGGTEPFLGTNPISIAIPTDGSFPITLDMATSVVAMGKIDHAPSEVSEIPEEWAVDGDGRPTTDPEAVAALRPVGGPKGYGLGMIIDILCSELAGARRSPDVGALYDEFDEPMRLGHALWAVDIATFADPAEFRARIGEYIDAVKAVPSRAGIDEIMVPGEPEARTKRHRERNGIPLTSDTWTSLQRLADRYDCVVPTTE